MRPANICSQEKHPGRTTEGEQDDEDYEYKVACAKELGGGHSTINTFSTTHLNTNTINNRAARFAKQAEAWNQGGEVRKQAQTMLAIGKQIQQLREEQRWTRSDLAQHTGLDPEHLFLLEHGLLTAEEAATVLDGIALYLKIDNGLLQGVPDNAVIDSTEAAKGGHRFSRTPEPVNP